MGRKGQKGHPLVLSVDVNLRYYRVCIVKLTTIIIAGNFQGRKLSQISRFDSHPTDLSDPMTTQSWYRGKLSRHGSDLLEVSISRNAKSYYYIIRRWVGPGEGL
jgi:hypothetical protein